MAWFTNRSIAAKILLCFICVMAVGLVRGALVYRGLSEIETSRNWTLHTYRVKEVIDHMIGATLTQDGDMQGYLLTDAGRFLEKANANNQAIQADLQTLKALTVDNALQQTNVDALAGLLETWRQRLPVVPIDPSEKDEASRAKATVLGSQDALAAVLAALGRIEAEEDRLLSQRSAAEATVLAQARWSNAVSPFLVLLAALGMALLLHWAIARPIAKLTVTMRRIAAGETDIDVPNTEWREEIGDMCRALKVIQDDMIEGSRLRKDREDMRLRTKRDRSALVASMADRFEEVVGRVVQAVSSSTAQLQTSAESLLDVAEWTSGQVKTVAGSTRQASETVQAVAGNAESLLESVGAINARMSRSTEIAGQAVAEADRTTTTIEGLSHSANRIGVIVDLINDVARQTNLLALNATIEAARAGDAGRGFAVVATEVKTLANQTATATEDIRRQIEGIQQAAAGSVAAIGQISLTIGEMARVTSELSAFSGVQGEATREMVRGTQTTAKATAAVSVELDKVSDGAVTTGTAANKVLSAAKDLAQQSVLLREEAYKFAASVRAG